MMWAATTGNLELVDLLLRSGANVNAENKSGYRALFRAVNKGHVSIVKLLLVSGADARAKTVRHGSRMTNTGTRTNVTASMRPSQALSPPKTALDKARECGLQEVVNLLVEWESYQGQERIKEEFPEAASNYVTSNFVSGADLRARTSPPRR